MWTGLLDPDAAWMAALVAVVATGALAWLVATLAARVARTVFGRLTGRPDRRFTSPIVRTPVRIIRAVVFLLIFFTFLAPALELAGAQIRYGLHVQAVAGWLLRSGLRVLLIVLLAYWATRVTAMFVERLEAELSTGEGPAALERAKRARTVGALLRKAVNTTVVAVAILMALQELDVNILPVLTGAGIAGLAIGFGAQTLVRDVIAGFFLILEDQVRVGDVVSVDGTSGLVEAINLRTIVLRDVAGTVHVIPNGSITRLSNLTKDYAYAVLDIGVAYKEDTDAVVDLLREVADQLAQDPRFAPSILAPLEVLGVEAFGDSQVTLKVRMKTVPLKQWEVGRELRRRIKKAFDARGIEIPFPHRVVIVRDGRLPPPVT
jgi:small-conductance mechanosensitive channel